MQKPGGIIALLDEAWYDLCCGLFTLQKLFVIEFREY